MIRSVGMPHSRASLEAAAARIASELGERFLFSNAGTVTTFPISR
jgi:hypothetical protein